MTISFGTLPGSDVPCFSIFGKEAMPPSLAVVQEGEPGRVLLYAVLRGKDGMYRIQFLCNGRVRGGGSPAISAPPAFILTEIQERLDAEGVETDFRPALSDEAMSALSDDLPLLCTAAAQVWGSWQGWVLEDSVVLPDTRMQGKVEGVPIPLYTVADPPEA